MTVQKSYVYDGADKRIPYTLFVTREWVFLALRDALLFRDSWIYVFYAHGNSFFSLYLQVIRETIFAGLFFLIFGGFSVIKKINAPMLGVKSTRRAILWRSGGW